MEGKNCLKASYPRRIFSTAVGADIDHYLFGAAGHGFGKEFLNDHLELFHIGVGLSVESLNHENSKITNVRVGNEVTGERDIGRRVLDEGFGIGVGNIALA